MEKEYDVLNSIMAVTKSSKYVKLNKDNISKVLQHIKKAPEESNEYPFIKNYCTEDKARFMLLYEALNFCYWGKEKWKVVYKDKEYSGSIGLFYALIRALEEGYNILDFGYLMNVPKEDFRQIFRGTAVIPLLDERFEITKAIATTVTDNLKGSVYSLFEKARSDKELLRIIIDNFDSFNDSSIYNGQLVYFFKRATLLVNDLYHNIKEIRDNIGSNKGLLACADYKIPQVLRQAGILEYSGVLAQLIDSETELAHNSDMEIEIRAYTIYVVEIIKEELNKKGIEMTSVEIDKQLWFLSKNKDQKSKPYHLTKTIAY
jgi:hypothetical protein